MGLTRWFANQESFETFRAAVEIAVFFIAIYAVLRFMEGTRGEGILKGMLAFLLFFMVVMTALEKVLNSQRIASLKQPSVVFIIVAALIIFQPEMRRALIQFGQNPFFQRLAGRQAHVIEELLRAAQLLAASRTGAIIVLEREIGLGSYVEHGVKLDAAISAELICSVFYKGTMLHDGGMIIQNDRIAATRCVFPLSENPELGGEVGTRHRAAAGVTEESDAIVIVVSEETGQISLAQNGKVRRGLSGDDLRAELIRLYSQNREKTA